MTKLLAKLVIGTVVYHYIWPLPWTILAIIPTFVFITAACQTDHTEGD